MLFLAMAWALALSGSGFLQAMLALALAGGEPGNAISALSGGGLWNTFWQWLAVRFGILFPLWLAVAFDMLFRLWLSNAILAWASALAGGGD